MKSKEIIDKLIAVESAELQALRTAIANVETSNGGGGDAARLTKEAEGD